MFIVRRPLVALLLLALLTTVTTVVQTTRPASAAATRPAPEEPLPPCTEVDGIQRGACPEQPAAVGVTASGSFSGDGATVSVRISPGVPICDTWARRVVWDPSPCWRNARITTGSPVHLTEDGRLVNSGPIFTAENGGSYTITGRSLWTSTWDASTREIERCNGTTSAFHTYVWGGHAQDAPWRSIGQNALWCDLTWEGDRPDALRGSTWIPVHATLEVVGNEPYEGGTVATTWVRVSGDMQHAGPTAAFDAKWVPSQPARFSFVDDSTAPDGHALTYAWSFGDGSTSTSANPAHTYDDPGTYTVSLTVEDIETGLEDTTTQSVTVPAPELTVSITRPDGSEIGVGERFPVTLRIAAGNGHGDLSGIVLDPAEGVSLSDDTLARFVDPPTIPQPLTIPPNTSETFVFSVETLKEGSLFLEAAASGQDQAGRTVSDTAQLRVPVEDPIVGVRWEAPDQVVAGSTFDATLVLDNQRGNAVDVTLHEPDHLAILELVSAPRSGERSIPVGETRYGYRFRAEHAIAAAFFDVTLDIHDPETGAADHPTRRHTLEVTPAELRATVTVPDSPVVAGETARVELELENVTDEDVTGIAVPEGLVLDPSTGSSVAEVEAGGTTLAPGATTRWRYDVTVTADAADDIGVQSFATGVLASAPGGGIRSNTATATLDVADALTIEVVPPQATPVLGEPFSFDVVVRNNHFSDSLEAIYDEGSLFGFKEDQYELMQPQGELFDREVSLAPKSQETFTYTLSSEITPVALRAVATAPYGDAVLESVDEASIHLEAETLDIEVASGEDDDGMLEVTAFVTNRSADVTLTDVRFTTFSPLEWNVDIPEGERGQLSRTTEDPTSPPDTLAPGEGFERTWRFRLIDDGTVRLAVGVEADGDDDARFAAASYTEVELGKESAFARAQQGLVAVATDGTLRLRQVLAANTGGASDAVVAGISGQRPDSELSEWEISTARSFGLPDDALAFLPDDRNEAIQHVARLATLTRDKTDEGRLNGARTVLGGLATALGDSLSFYGDMLMSGDPGAFYRSALEEAGLDDGLVGEAYSWLEDNSKEPWPPVEPWSLDAVRRDLGVADDVVLGALEALAGSPRDALLASQDRAFAALAVDDPILALAELKGGVEEAKTIVATEVAVELLGEAGLVRTVDLAKDAAKSNDYLRFLDTPIGVGRKGGHTDSVQAVLERYAAVKHGDLAGLPNGPISLEDASRFVPEKDFALLRDYAAEFKARHGVDLTWELVTINPLAVPKLQAGNLTPKTEMMGAHKAFTSADIAMGAPRRFGGELGGFDPSVSRLSQAEIARIDVEIPGFAARYQAQASKWAKWSASEDLWSRGVRSADDVPADLRGYWKGFYEPVRRAEMGEITIDVDRPAGRVEQQTYHLQVERGDGWFRILDRRNPMVDADGSPILDASGNPVPRPYGSDLDLHAVLPEGGYPAGKRGQWETEVYAWSKNSGLSVGLHGWTDAGFDMAANPTMAFKRAGFAIERTDPSTWIDHAEAYAQKINGHPQLGPAVREKFGRDVTAGDILKDAGLMDEAGELVLEAAQKVLRVTENGIQVAHGTVSWLPSGTTVGPRMLAASPSAFLLGALAAADPAPTFVVDDVGDGVDGAPGEGTCATAGGSCTLRAAIQEANAAAGAVVVGLPAGTVTLTVPGADEDAAASGDLDVTDDLTIKGDPSGTTIDADGLDRAFHIHGAALTLVDVTIVNGTADGEGGAIYVAHGVLDASGVTLSDNAANGDGGAIFAAASELVLAGVIATGNVGARGGAVATTFSTVTITDGSLSDNVGSYGGALASSYDLDLDITGTLLARNHAHQGEGGALFLEGHDAPSADAVPGFTITDATFSDNGARHLGGAIALATLVGPFDDATFTVAGTRFTGNQAAGGGAIASDHGRLVVTGSTFADNVAESGTGGAIRSLQPLTVTGSTFTGNRARNEGGAIAAFGSLDASDSTFTENRSWDIGGAMWVFGTLTTGSLRFAGNEATGDADLSFVPAPAAPPSSVVPDGGAAQRETTYRNGTRPIDPACPRTVPAPTFTDLGATHGPAVACASWWSLVEGYDTTTFGSGETLTRGQMFTIIARLVGHLDIAVPSASPDAFADDDGTTHEPAADLLAALGLAEGFADGTAGLGTPVTRAQVAALLARAAAMDGDELPAGLGRFGDLGRSVHRDPIERLAAAGVLAGYDDARFGPTDSVTRAQTASVVVRYLARLIELERATLPVYSTGG